MWRAHQLKEALRAVFDPDLTPVEAAGLLDRFTSWAQRCRLASFVTLQRTIRKHRSGILAALEIGITNGPHWVETRSSARAGTLRSGDPGPSAITAKFDQLLQFISLRLGRELGTDIQLALSRAETHDQDARSQGLLVDLVEHGRLAGGLRIPDAVGPLVICADLRAAQITASVEIAAPAQSRSTTRVRWLLRQLSEAPASLRIDAYARHSRSSMSALLSEVREDAELLVEDRNRELRRFELHLTEAMGIKRGNGRGSFIASMIDLVDRFYAEVVQGLRPWTAPAPRMRKPDQVTTDTTAMSSQDDIDGEISADEEGDDLSA